MVRFISLSGHTYFQLILLLHFTLLHAEAAKIIHNALETLKGELAKMAEQIKTAEFLSARQDAQANMEREAQDLKATNAAKLNNLTEERNQCIRDLELKKIDLDAEIEQKIQNSMTTFKGSRNLLDMKRRVRCRIMRYTI